MRTHETKLKGQGVLAPTFVNPDDRITIKGLESFARGKKLIIEMKDSDERVGEIGLVRLFHESQIEWFKAGPALNLMAKQASGN
ncbi:ACO1_4 [Sanghuangporus weigelae]